MVRQVRAGAEDPLRADDQVLPAGSAHRRLARQLAAAVGGERRGRRVLRDGRRGPAVEHEVGRDVDEQRAAAAGLGEHARGERVSPHGDVRLGLAAVEP
jgi:hypothetical protein